MKVQPTLIRDYVLYEFELDHNPSDPTKNICCVKGEGTVGHTIVTRLLKKFCLVCKELAYQTRTGRPKIRDSEALFHAIDVIWWVTLGEYQVSLASSSPVYFITFTKSIQSSWIMPHLIRILQRFASPEFLVNFLFDTWLYQSFTRVLS